MKTTAQTMFDKAYKGVVQQARPGWHREYFGCQYVSETDPDVHCGVGHIMTPKERKAIVDTGLNDQAIENILDNDKVFEQRILRKTLRTHRSLLIAIQTSHDAVSHLFEEGDPKAFLNAYKTEMYKVAKQFKLDTEVLDA
jgi:hypothetical protein